jgi:hypothetical protein
VSWHPLDVLFFHTFTDVTLVPVAIIDPESREPVRDPDTGIPVASYGAPTMQAAKSSAYDRSNPLSLQLGLKSQ